MRRNPWNTFAGTLLSLLILPLQGASQGGGGGGQIRGDVVFPNPASITLASSVTGELRQWHTVTLTIDGPRANQYGRTLLAYEAATGVGRLDARPQNAGRGPNPFMDYRMTVTFTHESGSPSYSVPGYFAADGNAAESGAFIGNKWRAHLAPDRTGTWRWEVSFLAGVGAAVDEAGRGEPFLPYHGQSGSFVVEASDKAAPDFRARGRLSPSGGYLRFAGDGSYFLKTGADSPETLLAYSDFAGTVTMREPGHGAWIGTRDGDGLHHYLPHVQDWREGDPTWRDGQGKGLIGALNYLSSKGVNSISFLTYGAGGDGDNLWPFVSRNEKLNYDVAKLDQWGIAFAHAQSRGIFLHFKLQEQENDASFPLRARQSPTLDVPEALDRGELGPERRLYTRELIARFGHNLALNWNMGEETTMRSEELRAWAAHIRAVDPYDHLVVVHTFPNTWEEVYTPLLGELSEMTGVSVQAMYTEGHLRTLEWIRASEGAGRRWAVAFDEQGNANLGVPPDIGFAGWTGVNNQGDPLPNVHDIRRNSLWGPLMAGAWGVEYYFGYNAPHNDLVAEDFRSRDGSWRYAGIARSFFEGNAIPFWEMSNCNPLVGNSQNDNSRYCLAKVGEIYLVYLPQGGAAQLDLSSAGNGTDFTVSWFDPRNGGPLRMGSVTSVQRGGTVSLGTPPSEASEDWLVVVR